MTVKIISWLSSNRKVGTFKYKKAKTVIRKILRQKIVAKPMGIKTNLLVILPAYASKKTDIHRHRFDSITGVSY